MTHVQRRIPCVALLWLAAVVLMMSAVSAFSPGMPSPKASSKSSPKSSSPKAPDVAAAAPVTDAAAPAAVAAAPTTDGAAAPSESASSSSTTTSGEAPKQSEYGKSLELPTTYASCGQCGSTYALTEEAMGTAKGGRRMECSVCGHTWFQSRDRIATLGGGYEMIPLPERDMERIQLNMKEGRHPKWFGDFKMYVGNISFQSSEEDLVDIFSTIGPVGEAIMVRDETGRSRGFGFVTMRNKEDGEKAIVELDGADLKGRNLNVRPSNN